MPRDSKPRGAERPQSSPSKPPAKRGRARAVLDRPPAPQGWRATDAVEAEHPIFGTFRTRSETGGAYEVEIRSLDGFANSCGCIDHRVNGLGTCKHVEGVLAALRRTHAKVVRAAQTR